MEPATGIALGLGAAAVFFLGGYYAGWSSNNDTVDSQAERIEWLEEQLHAALENEKEQARLFDEALALERSAADAAIGRSPSERHAGLLQPLGDSPEADSSDDGPPAT